MDVNKYIKDYKNTNLATSLLQGGNAIASKFGNNRKGIGDIPSIAVDYKAPRINKDESVFREQQENLDEMTNRTISEIRLSGKSEVLPAIYENYRKSIEKIGQERSRYSNQVDNKNAVTAVETANKTAESEANDKLYREKIASQRNMMLAQANAQNDQIINQSIAGYMNNNLKADEMAMMADYFKNNPESLFNYVIAKTPEEDVETNTNSY
jgi:hypothetical protein